MNYEISELLFFPSNNYSPFKYKYFFGGKLIDNDELIVIVASKVDFSLLSKFGIKGFLSCYLKTEIVFHDNTRFYWVLNLDALNVQKYESSLVPQYIWNDFHCCFNLEKRIYEVRNLFNEIVGLYESKYPYVIKFYPSGVLEYFNHQKQDNWLRCLDPNGGSEKWRVDLPWKMVRVELYENLIILDYHAYENIRDDKGYEGQIHWENPNKYSIVIDGETGRVIWKRPFGYQKMDRENSVLVGSRINEFDKRTGSVVSASALEVDLLTGKILTEVEIQPMDRFGYFLHFVDAEGIYYTNHYGAFGKIRKEDGQIIWEFYLVDDKGEKRRLSEWLLLGNGKLVLQAMPNHPNGDLTCIFDPKENMRFSTIKDGKRTS